MEASPSLQIIAQVANACACALLESGGETYRAEETVSRICAHYALDQVHVIAFPTGLFINLTRGEENFSTVRRIQKRATDLARVDQVNTVSRLLVDGRLSPQEALERLKNPPAKSISPLVSTLCIALSAGFFCVLFGGGPFDFAVSAFCCGLVQFLCGKLRTQEFSAFMGSLIGSALTTAFALLITGLFSMGDTSPIIIGAIMPLLPGLAMTNAIRDTMRGDLVSGVARGAEALLVAVALGTGAGLVLKAAMLLRGGL